VVFEATNRARFRQLEDEAIQGKGGRLRSAFTLSQLTVNHISQPVR